MNETTRHNASPLQGDRAGACGDPKIGRFWPQFDRNALGALVKWARRLVLRFAACVLPGFAARHLARRYLRSTAKVDLEKLKRRKNQTFVDLGNNSGLIRFRPDVEAAQPRRVLIIHGHDGHVRQFARLIRSLCKAGVEVDALILPGHLTEERPLCSVASIVGAIHAANDECGPYDGMVGHCVGANSMLFAMNEGLTCPRVAFVSAPINLTALIRLGGQQYGLEGACLDQFVENVSALGAPYRSETPWRPMAAQRREAFLSVHALHDYAAPVEDMRELVNIWPGAQIEVFERGDHNTILSMAPAMDCITAFMIEEPQNPLAARDGAAHDRGAGCAL